MTILALRTIKIRQPCELDIADLEKTNVRGREHPLNEIKQTDNSKCGTSPLVINNNYDGMSQNTKGFLYCGLWKHIPKI